MGRTTGQQQQSPLGACSCWRLQGCLLLAAARRAFTAMPELAGGPHLLLRGGPTSVNSRFAHPLDKMGE